MHFTSNKKKVQEAFIKSLDFFKKKAYTEDSLNLKNFLERIKNGTRDR